MTIHFDGHGGARHIEAADLPGLTFAADDPGFVWQHLRLSPDATVEKLARADLDGFVIDALTAHATRPRCTVHNDGVILTLRGVNSEYDAEPGDMISLRLWLCEHRVISVWRRPLEAVSELIQAIEHGKSPVSPGDFVARLALRLADRAEPTISDLYERVDGFEDLLLVDEIETPKIDLATTRRISIMLRPVSCRPARRADHDGTGRSRMARSL